MRAGSLRHRADLQQQGTTVDPATGDRVTAWVNVAAAVPVEIVPLSGREFLAAAASQSQVTSRITMRYRPGVTAAHRLRQGDVVYNIEAVLPDNKSGREWLTLMCSQGVNDG